MLIKFVLLFKNKVEIKIQALSRYFEFRK